MSKVNVEKLKRKIAALLAKAGGTDNQIEAEAFAAKAQALLTEHQLEIGDVVKTDPIERTVIFVGPKTKKDWHGLLPNAIAKYYGCKCVAFHEQGIIAYTAVGRESGRVMAAEMFPFLLEQVRLKALEYQKVTLFSRKRCMNDIVHAFVLRLQTLIKAQETTAAATGGHSRALVLVDEAEAWMKEHINDLTPGKRTTLQVNGLSEKLAGEISLAGQITDGDDGKPLALEHH
jgi:hypothetical protein